MSPAWWLIVPPPCAAAALERCDRGWGEVNEERDEPGHPDRRGAQRCSSTPIRSSLAAITSAVARIAIILRVCQEIPNSRQSLRW
jgi:hypothetical protein